MEGKSDLKELIRNMQPRLNPGIYVFATVKDLSEVDRNDTLCEFKEVEGTTVVLRQDKADFYGLSYSYLAAWITLEIHSSLEAVGLTAAFSKALAQHKISCNVIAGFYHDHIFVEQKDAEQALQVLRNLAKSG